MKYCWLLICLIGCKGTKKGSVDNRAPLDTVNMVKPVVVTEPVRFDTDDPAIWINPSDASKSLVIGTDKATDGGLYLFNLEGKIVNQVTGLKRPNNVDICYGLILSGKSFDVAVATERETKKLRIFSMPDLQPLDNGGIDVFEGETEKGPMGIAMYTRATDHAIFAIVSRKSGPPDNYLWEYKLLDDGKGFVKAERVRTFGKYSGKKEIESVAVDNRLGYVYYSDEMFGVHKYYANPDADSSNKELAVFGKTGFISDHEGISIYQSTDTTGYILVSNQQANTFMVFAREGAAGNPNDHPLLAQVPVAAIESDGSEVTNINLGPQFPKGLFVAMSNGKVFQYYDWRDIENKIKTAQVKR